MRWSMNNELERIWKRAVVAQQKYRPTICLAALNHQTQNYDAHSTSRYSKLAQMQAQSVVGTPDLSVSVSSTR